MPGRTLDQLEGQPWPEPEFESSLVKTCHRLRSKPVDEFTVEDLRIMIGQCIGLPHLVPRALDVLEIDPLAEGDHYPGDLLKALVRAGSFLESSPDFLKRVLNVVDRALDGLGEVDENLLGDLKWFIDRHRPRETTRIDT